MHTPMTSWLIKIDDRGTDTVKLADLDFSALTGIRLEFQCHFALE